jgi:hypothetical protein
VIKLPSQVKTALTAYKRAKREIKFPMMANITWIPVAAPNPAACKTFLGRSVLGGTLTSWAVSGTSVSGIRIFETASEQGIDMIHEVNRASPETPIEM